MAAIKSLEAKVVSDITAVRQDMKAIRQDMDRFEERIAVPCHNVQLIYLTIGVGFASFAYSGRALMKAQSIRSGGFASKENNYMEKH